MHEFTYTPDPANPHDHVKVAITTKTPDLSEVLDAMETYLRAAGFVFNGTLDIISFEEMGMVPPEDVDLTAGPN